MQTLKSCLWRQLVDRLPIYRTVRQRAVKRVTALLRTELLNDHLLRDLGLPRWDAEGRDPDARLPRL